MNFEERISMLRKEAGLSQEELAEKLNVTRQTISKWELGQSKPDFDKLMEISKVFNIGLEELTNGSEKVEKQFEEDSPTDFNTQPRKWILVILIIIALVIVVVLADKFIKNMNSKKEQNNDANGISSLFDRTFKIFDNIGGEINSQTKSSFNSDYELYTGAKWGTSCEPILNNAITNNKKNTEHLIIVKFKDKETSNPTEITEIKQSLGKWEEYEISLNYDDNGYVSEIIIETVKSSNTSKKDNEFEKTSFNSNYEIHIGTKLGVACEPILNNAITNNKTNETHTIVVKHNGKETSDPTEITNIKKSLGQWTNYEISLNYDENGYVSEIIIE